MAKLSAKFSFQFHMISPSTIADETGMNLLLRGRMKPLQEWYDEIDATTDEDLFEYYNKYIAQKMPSIVIIGPPSLHQQQQAETQKKQ